MILFPDINKIAVCVLNVDIYWYGICHLFGFIICFILFKFSNNISNLHTYTTSCLVLIGIIFGSRFGYFVFYKHNDINILNLFKFWKNGRSFYGGSLVTLFLLYIYTKKTNLNFILLISNLLKISPLGLFFGRLGNLLNEELYGNHTTLIIGIIFPNGGPYSRHPTQLYEALFEGPILYIIMNKMNISKNPYYSIITFLLIYGFIRIIISILREESSNLLIYKTNLILSIIIIVIAIILIIKNKVKI